MDFLRENSSFFAKYYRILRELTIIREILSDSARKDHSSRDSVFFCEDLSFFAEYSSVLREKIIFREKNKTPAKNHSALSQYSIVLLSGNRGMSAISLYSLLVG